MCSAMSCATSRACVVRRVDAAELDEHADGAAVVLDVLVAVEQAVGRLEADDAAELDRSRRACREQALERTRRPSRRRTAARRGRRRPRRRRACVSAASAPVKSSPLATKSVSQLSSTIAPTLPSTSDVDRALGRPRGSLQLRRALARPFSRSQSLARSKSPSFSLERLLAVHHPGAGRLAQRGDVLGARCSAIRVALLDLGAARGRGGSALAARRRRSAAAASAAAASAAAAARRPSALASASSRLALALRRRRRRRAPAAARRPWPPAPRASSGFGAGGAGLRLGASVPGRAPACAAASHWPSSTASAIDAAHEVGGADRVVVAGDHVVDDVGVAVGVDDRDDRDAEPVRLGDRDVLLLGVDHEDRARAASRGCWMPPRLRSSFSSSRLTFRPSFLSIARSRRSRPGARARAASRRARARSGSW